MPAERIVVLGAGGRLGALLRGAWAGDPAVIWHARTAPAGLVWDMERTAPPPLSPGAAPVVLCLAGVTKGDSAAMARNGALGMAALRAAQEWGARGVLLASTVAVYGAGRGVSAETDPPAPLAAYGAEKSRMEAAVQQSAAGMPVVALRIANVVGADALIGGNLGRVGPVVLDPVPGQPDGPERSWIGPLGLARVLRGLCDLMAAGATLPPALNIAAPGVAGMAALLRAAGIDWHFGPENPAVLARAAVDTTRLEALLPGAAGPGGAQALIDDWRQARGQGA